MAERLSVGSFLETDVASAATCDIGAITTLKARITGTTTITSFGVVHSRIRLFVRFAGVLTLTHHATSLILPGGANIVTAAGDTCIAVSDTSGDWRVYSYTRASGKAVVASAFSEITGKPTTLAGYNITDAAPAFNGALVKKSADQTGADYSANIAITWDEENTSEYDTASWHSTTVNPSRFTIPAGVSRIRVGAQVGLSLVTAGDLVQLSVKKNNSVTYPGVPTANVAAPSNGSPRLQCQSRSLAVVPGDYFEVFLGGVTDTSINMTASISWFAIEKVS